MSRSVRISLSLVVLCAWGEARAWGQASVSFSSQRPFVISFTPVFGAGGRVVGGVSVDAAGALDRARLDESGQLRDAWRKALEPVPAELGRGSPLRKISLRRLEAAILRHIEQDEPLPDEIRYLAGLQRVQYVLAYPAQGDIVLAGPAEAWRLGEQPQPLGVDSGRPPLRLDDLLEALRTAEAAAAGQGISCSIDPSEEGLQRLERLMKSRGFRISEASVRQMEQTLGPQSIAITGVAPDSHYARVLVAADYLMKRLAMNMDRSPVAGMPSYLELLQNHRGRPPRNAMPRWWLAVNYDQVMRSPDGLAWQLQGQGVKAMSEDGFLSETGKIENVGRPSPLGKRWADSMTENYDELSQRVPVFAELRNCMDLAVVAALLVREDLYGQVGNDLVSLTDGRLRGERLHVPKTVGSQASLVRYRRGWIVSVSGGVEVDSWSVLEEPRAEPELAKVRQAAAPPGERWWWD